MTKINLRKIKSSDKNYFAKWWRDKELLKVTSGILKLISDEEVDKYFQAMLNSKDAYNFIILADGKIIGHISLAKRRNDWRETQIVIGEKNIGAKELGKKQSSFLSEKQKRLEFPKFI